MQQPERMRRLRWLVVVIGVVAAGGVVTLLCLPEVVRRLAIVQIEATTHRPTSIDAVELSLLRGRVGVRGLRLTERDGTTPFADLERLDARLHVPALLRAHLWLRELVVDGSTVRVVRLPNGGFNFSDLIAASGATERRLDVTVDRFTLQRGTVSLEDRALRETRTWVSEQITIDAHNVSTRRGDGTAVARSLTAGSPVSLEMWDFRLYPIHFRAVAKTEGTDLTPLQLYLPPSTPVTLVRGRVSTSVSVVHDARTGLRADATGRFEDVILTGGDGGEDLARLPRLTVDVRGLGFNAGEVEVARLALDGAIRMRDPTAPASGRYPLSSVRASVSDLTWPARTAGRLEAAGTVPGGGALSIVGTVRPPPAATQLTLRLTGLQLAPWAQLLPIAARVAGRAEANLSIDEPLTAGLPTRIKGVVAVDRPTIPDARQELLSARRIEARGLELHWPTRLVVARVQVDGPRAMIERERAGAVTLVTALTPPATSAAPERGAPKAPALGVEIGEVGVRDGRVTWHDAMRTPPARLEVAALEATTTNAGWPLRGPLGVRGSLRPPGGGLVRLSGRIGLDPFTADVRVAAQGAELSPYQPYVPTPAVVSGAADLDVALTVDSVTEGRATARGTAGLSRVDVRDGERTVARLERATAVGLEVDWPKRVSVDRLALTRPWLLLERDTAGSLGLRRLLTPPRSTATTSETVATDPLALTIRHVSVADGGARVVDRAVSPSFAVDVQPARLRLDGLSTQGGKPSRFDLTAYVGAATELALAGTVAAFGGPLRLELDGELREFAVPRTNPYLLQQVGWKSTEGRLTTKLHCRIDGDALSARTDVRVSRLQLTKAASADETQRRIGLPLGLLTTLMKDRRGDITLSFPVGGRLSDPAFDVRETMWSALRSVAINAVTLPVSWIGRVQFTPDSRIEKIQVDPISFEPGTATLTAQGEARAVRVAAFLDQSPQVRMALTPVVTTQDLVELRRRVLDAAIERAARKGRLTREEAIVRLHAEQRPGRPVPESPDAALAALLEEAELPTSQHSELAAARLEAVRAVVTRAGIDAARLPENALAQRDDGDSQVDLEILEPETPRPSRLRETLRRLGVPLGAPGSEP
jgi:uncharacterized protein involved in outer membrane biogenesis